MKNKIVLSIIFILFSFAGKAQEAEFNKFYSLDWKTVFEDSGSDDWQNGWFLDGQRASIKNMEDGMFFAAGPIAKDDACHAVLWTKQSFNGDLKIEYDFTKMDNINRWVNIIYIQATGIEENPYTKDIAEWSHLRKIPFMRTYYKNMNLIHISYAAFPNNDAKDKVDYVRARRYPLLDGKKFSDIQVGESYEDSEMFVPGMKYHITIIKKDDLVYMKVAGDGESAFFQWDFSGHPIIIEGRIGLRHMWTRCSKYANFTVSELKIE